VSLLKYFEIEGFLSSAEGDVIKKWYRQINGSVFEERNRKMVDKVLKKWEGYGLWKIFEEHF
jgi:hypothetical protein